MDGKNQGNDSIEGAGDESNVLERRKKKVEEEEIGEKKKKKKIVKPKKDIKEILESKLIGQRYAVEQVKPGVSLLGDSYSDFLSRATRPISQCVGWSVCPLTLFFLFLLF